MLHANYQPFLKGIDTYITLGLDYEGNNRVRLVYIFFNSASSLPPYSNITSLEKVSIHLIESFFPSSLLLQKRELRVNVCLE